MLFEKYTTKRTNNMIWTVVASLALILIYFVNVSESVDGNTDFTSQERNQIEKMTITIYYETLCHYSIEFFRKQLIPLWEKIGEEYLNLRFVPYGNAHTFFQPGFVVTGCHHGVEECYGNKLHACALEYLPKAVARDFIFCSMTQEYPPDSSNCSKTISPEYNFNTDVLEFCVEGLAGDLGLAMKGLQSLDFVGNGVPSISINGVLIESDDVLADLLTYICGILPNPPRHLGNQLFELPESCKLKREVRFK